MNLKPLLLAVGLACSNSVLAATLVQDVRVFDGERMHAKRSVLIDNGKIVNANFKGRVPVGTTLVDGAGKTLLPGLIDSHVHAYQHLELPLLFGVTTQVDMFTGVPLMQEVTRKMHSGANTSQADLFSAGTLATAPGGHGTQFGMPIPTLTKPEDSQAFVDARIAEGSHFIKIVMEEGSPGMAFNKLGLPVVQALVKAAHARGKLAVVHVSTIDDARAAIDAGADGLVHLFIGTQIDTAALASLVRLAKQRGAFVIPTFSVLESMAGVRSDDVLGDATLTGLLDDAQLAPLRNTYGKSSSPDKLAVPQALTLAMRQAGVPVLAGTDAGNAGTQHGISMHHELASLVKAGLTPSQALAAATSAPAKAFRLGQRGRIANGYKADLLLVEGDAGADIANTRRIVTVWKDGVDASAQREARRSKLAEARKAVPAPLALPADGRISAFTKEKLGSAIGFGWMPSSDSFMGGKSSVKVQLQDAAPGEQAALEVNASIVAGFPFPWAGLSYMPGKQPMQPADLSAAKVLRFKVRGDGKQYQLGMMSQGVQQPASVPFTANADWQEVAIPFVALKGIDPAKITMIGFNAGPVPGNYSFQVADVRLALD